MKKRLPLMFIAIVCGLLFSTLTSFAANVKQDFLSRMVPAALEANFQVMVQRNKLQEVHITYMQTGMVSEADMAYLTVLCEDYEMKNHDFVNTSPALMLNEVMEELLRRVDVVPVQLILAQSIIETGWGKSRTAQATHNYFGITSSQGGKFVVTTSTSGNTVYYLANFATDADGIKAYISLLNSKRSYAAFRNLRADLRSTGRPLDAAQLSAGLMKYSELGQVYIDKVNFVIGKYLSGELLADAVL